MLNVKTAPSRSRSTRPTRPAAADLVNCEKVLLQNVYGWLSEEQRAVTRVALEYASPDYSGAIRVDPGDAQGDGDDSDQCARHREDDRRDDPAGLCRR